MILTERTIPYQGDPTFELWGVGDIHEGTMHHDRRDFLKTVERINTNPYALWIGLGDNAECIIPGDPRFEPTEIDRHYYQNSMMGELAVEQTKRFVSAVECIKDKCLGLNTGNHEAEIQKRHSVDLIKLACEELFGRPPLGQKPTGYLSDMAIIRLTFQKVDDKGERIRSCVKTILSAHGCGGGRKGGSTVNRLEDLMGDFDVDIVMFGHVHKRVTTRAERLGLPARGKLVLSVKKQVGGSSGSYYQAYHAGSSSYAQRIMVKPSSLGSIRFMINPNTEDVEVVN